MSKDPTMQAVFRRISDKEANYLTTEKVYTLITLGIIIMSLIGFATSCIVR